MNRLVLIVDDDPDLTSGMTAELQRMSLEVVSALHYDAAIKALSVARTPRLICIDLELPTQSGYDAARSAARACPSW
jgi:DNA-binding response OmpR family regulator